MRQKRLARFALMQALSLVTRTSTSAGCNCHRRTIIICTMRSMDSRRTVPLSQDHLEEVLEFTD
jgi:hypothetical protein